MKGKGGMRIRGEGTRDIAGSDGLTDWPLDCKEIQLIHSKGDQLWDFFWRNDAKAETPVLCPLMWRVDPFENTLMLEGFGDRRKRGQQRMRCLDGITSPIYMFVWVNSGSWWWTGKPGVLRFMGSPRFGHNWVTELNWTKCSLSPELMITKQNNSSCSRICFSLSSVPMFILLYKVTANTKQKKTPVHSHPP